MALYAVCNDNIAPLPGATAATRTSPESGQRSGGSPARAARRGGESRAHLAGPTAPHGLERCQAVRRRLDQHFFWQWELLQVPGPYDRQQRIRPHGQGHMPIPPRPTPDLIMIEPHLALGRLEVAFDGPPHSRYPDHLRQHAVLRREDHIGPHLPGVATATAHQQPAAPLRVHRIGQGQPTPVIPPGPFGPVPGAQPRPAVLRQSRQDRFDLPLLPAEPDVFLARRIFLDTLIGNPGLRATGCDLRTLALLRLQGDLRL